MQTKKIGKINPIDLFKKIDKELDNLSFLTSSSSKGWQSFLSFLPEESFSYKINFKNKGWQKKLSKEIENFINFINKNTAKNNKIVGYFSYNLGCGLQNIKLNLKDDLNLPDIHFFAFKNWCEWENNILYVKYKDKYFLETIEKQIKNKELRPPTSKINFETQISPEEYKKSFEKIKNYIENGYLYQVNLTHQLKTKTDIESRKLFTKIADKNKIDYLACFEEKDFQILSASPEKFVQVRNKKIITEPIKGTFFKGKTQQERKQNKQKLLNNKKEKAELDMITDLLRNDIGKISQIGSVKLEKAREVLFCPEVIHTYSKIAGKIEENLHPIKAVLSMLPGGSITGCPKREAIKIIDQTESQSRGIYTGCFGIIEPNLDMDFSIIIRTIVKKNKDIYLGVGGGIVYDSILNKEFEETLDKAKSLTNI